MVYEFRAKLDENMKVLDTEWCKLDENEIYENDAFLPIFDKKSIIKYANKAIEEGEGEIGYLCIFDLDNFKNVNDTFGHLFGDEVLVSVCDAINKVISGRGTAGRIGGDEIMLVIDNVLSKAEFGMLMKKVRESVEKLYKEKLGEANVTATIGACEFPTYASKYEDAFKIADAMLYRGKEKGKNRYIIYDPEIHGDIINTNMQETVKSNANLVTSKEALVLMIIQEHLFERRHTVMKIFEMVSQSFDLDEICVIREDDSVPFLFEKVKTDCKRTCEFVKSPEFSSHFKENNLVEINQAKYADQYSKDAKQYMEERNILGMLVYKMENYGGYIYFINRAEKSRGWDKRDVTMLNILGKIFELSFLTR